MQLLHLIAVLSAALVAAKDGDDPVIAKFPGFKAWFTSNGGAIDSRVTIGYDENGIRGMVATEAIPKDTIIIECPSDLVVRPEVSDSDQCATIASIAEHLKMGVKSKWHAYFDFDDSLGSRLPHEWKDGSRAFDELQGLPPSGETHRHINWYKNACKHGDELDDLEIRAFKMFLTRSADIGLIPMYDLMNHHNGLLNTYLQRTEGNGLKVLALTEINPNEQLWNTYNRAGWESSTDVFITYGFLEDYPQLWRWSDDDLILKNQENENYHYSRYIGNENERHIEPNSDKHELLVLSPTVAAMYPTKELVGILGNGQRSVEEWIQLINNHHRILRTSRARGMGLSSKAILEASPTTIDEDESILAREKYLLDKVNKLGRVDTNKEDVVRAIQYRLALKKALKLAKDLADSGSFADDSDEL